MPSEAAVLPLLHFQVIRGGGGLVSRVGLVYGSDASISHGKETLLLKIRFVFKMACNKDTHSLPTVFNILEVYLLGNEGNVAVARAELRIASPLLPSQGRKLLRW